MTEQFWGPLNTQPTRNSHAQVVDAIGADIIRGRHAQGAALPRDEEMASRFGVSRTQVRKLLEEAAARPRALGAGTRTGCATHAGAGRGI
jgi:DNA-binding transcriptional MocR family regulator